VSGLPVLDLIYTVWGGGEYRSKGNYLNSNVKATVSGNIEFFQEEKNDKRDRGGCAKGRPIQTHQIPHLVGRSFWASST
jgi:hypothetical protein